MEVESKMNESVDMVDAIKEVADELRLLRHFLEFKRGLMDMNTYASMCQDCYFEKLLKEAKDSKTD